MPSVLTLLRLAGLLLGAAAVALSLVDPDVVTRRSGSGAQRAGAAPGVALHVVAASIDPVRAATLGR